ncbi:MAG: glycosyltransferase [Saprospiraceae bacterium]|nr:glycosyltransferase [Saprospiraceae bacterium]MDW8484622.1 glycosyltransferase [Saprospiraceae bacterium]
MKIVMLTPAHPLRGGIAASSERLSREFQAMRHEVVLYSFSLQYPSFLFPGKSQYTNDPPPKGLRIETRLNSIHPVNWIFSARAIVREQPERVVVRFWLPFLAPCLGSILRLMRLFAKYPIRVTALIDNIIPHERRLGDRFLARYFVRSCDDFVVMSHSVGEAVRALLPAETPAHHIRYAPHPIYDIYGDPISQEEARRQLGLPIETPLVLFFGLIRPYKGLDLLLEALRETPEVHALIAGECYENWRPYQEIITRLRLEGRVHLHLSFIPNDRVNLYFSAADLVVQPYRTATQSGISQIAFHFEKPLIVTNVGGLPEIVQHDVSGYVVPPEPRAIAQAIRDFFEQRRAAALIKGMQLVKERFSWRSLAETICQDSE